MLASCAVLSEKRRITAGTVALDTAMVGHGLQTFVGGIIRSP